jgi:hypothetical protein
MGFITRIIGLWLLMEYLKSKHGQHQALLQDVLFKHIRVCVDSQMLCLSVF